MCSGSLSQNTALRNTREIASQFSLSFFVLWTQVFSLLVHREFWYIIDATRLGRTNFPSRCTFSVTVRLSWLFARLLGLKTLSSSVVHPSTLFYRVHRKMELCNYHSGQHCGWDCFHMDCAHGPSSRTFPPIVFSFSVLQLKIEKLFGPFSHLAQDRLLSRSPFSITGFPVLTCTGIFPVIEKSIQVIEHSLISCRRRRLWIRRNVSWKTMRAANFSRGLAILLVHEEEEITLVELERETIF